MTHTEKDWSAALPRINTRNTLAALPHNKREFACEVLRALAQSMTHNVPPAPALNGLLEGPWFRGPSLRASQARENLRLFIADLEDGTPTGKALMRHYSTALPRYALEAVVRAEDKGRLGSVLPVLCEVLSVDANPHNRFRAALFYPLMQLVITLAMLSGLLIFIVPKFGKMFDEMLPGVPLHDSMAALMALANASGLVFTSFWLLICGIAFVQVARPVIRNNEFMLSVAERLLGHVPFAGPILRSRSDLDLYQAMAALTATGIDIGEAAEQAAQVVRSPGAARRLIRFFRESQGGMPWVDAWQVAVEPSGLSEFLVRNAAVREDPASGFARAAQWEGNDLEHRYAALARWIEPLGILLNAFLVGITVYGLLGALFTLIREIA